jgi:hypothetical protein
MVRALLLGFTTSLTQLARQAERDTSVKVARQFFDRWLAHSAWEVETLYAHLNRHARRVLTRRGRVALYLDFTYLQHEWAVLQVSVGWQRRALPLYRGVIPRRQGGKKGGETALVAQGCVWLKEHLPAPLSRYVVVMDRGLPSHLQIRFLQQCGLRFVLRVRGEWKMTHPDYTGQLQDAVANSALVSSQPRLFADVVLGRKRKGRKAWSQAHVVSYQGVGYKDTWFLVTSERRATRAVAIYRERMRIECEFRDLKGPFGLDGLATWYETARVARFLAWVAAYEWWLALLWEEHRLAEWRPHVQVAGRLSWITITRAWLQHQIRRLAIQTLACL